MLHTLKNAIQNSAITLIVPIHTAIPICIQSTNTTLYPTHTLFQYLSNIFTCLTFPHILIPFLLLFILPYFSVNTIHTVINPPYIVFLFPTSSLFITIISFFYTFFLSFSSNCPPIPSNYSPPTYSCISLPINWIPGIPCSSIRLYLSYPAHQYP